MMTKSALPDWSFTLIGFVRLINGSKPRFKVGLALLQRTFFIFLFNSFRFKAVLTATGFPLLIFISLLSKEPRYKPMKSSAADLSKSLSHFTSTH